MMRRRSGTGAPLSWIHQNEDIPVLVPTNSVSLPDIVHRQACPSPSASLNRDEYSLIA